MRLATDCQLTFERHFIHYHTHFLFSIITHVGGSNGVNTGPTQHSLTTATPIKSQKICFKRKSTGWKRTPNKRRVSTPHLPILKPVSHTHNLLHSSPALPSLSFHASLLQPPSITRFCDARISSRNEEHELNSRFSPPSATNKCLDGRK